MGFGIGDAINKVKEAATGYANDRINDITGQFTTAQKSAQATPPNNVNRYNITVDIAGIKFSGIENATRIEYREVSDYWNANFPIRTLTVHVPYDSVQKILCNENKSDVNGIKLFDINVLVVPQDTNAFKNKAFNDGAFKGVLQQNDSSNDFMETLDASSRSIDREQAQTRIPLTFILYRDNELKYSQNFEINAVMTNPKLADIFMWALNKSNPTLKCCTSKFETNPDMGLMVIPTRSFPDLIKMMDYEVGFFKTNPIQFIEHNILFFLNRENNVNVTNKEMAFSITVNISRSSNTPTDKYIRKLDDQNYAMSIAASDINISISNSSSFGNSKKWIFPNGNVVTQNNSFSRNVDTIKKLTNVQPVLKLTNPVYEFADIDISENSLNFITPLTLIHIMDAMGKPRTYRISRSELTLTSGYTSNVRVRGFRLID